jgi:hypothetical protein
MAQLVIEKNETIDDIKSQFNSVYPFLQIGFFKESHTKGMANGKNKIVEGNTKLKQLKLNLENGSVDFNGKTTVWELESYFEKYFGLHVQVFRKSGSIWLETSATDSWTLEQQNEQGKFLDEDLKFEKESPDDHDMY